MNTFNVKVVKKLYNSNNNNKIKYIIYTTVFNKTNNVSIKK